MNTQDYQILLYYLFVYLTPLDRVLEKYPNLPFNLRRKNLSSEVNIITYCLMPNHFHLLLFQKTKNAISRFMQQITNAYTTYFNKKYRRVGSLVQGPFKSVLIETNESLLHINRYIHLNPVVAGLVSNIQNYQWSSYHNYIDKPSLITCSKDMILPQFSSLKSYEAFIKDHIDYAKQLSLIEHLTLED